MNFRTIVAFIAVAFIAGTQASPIPVAGSEAVTVPEANIEVAHASVADSSSPVSERGCKFWCY